MLRLGECVGVTDGVLARFGALSGLRHLSLAMCRRVTSDGLAHLSCLSGLAYLDLSYCGLVSDYHIDLLRQDRWLPRCKVRMTPPL